MILGLNVQSRPGPCLGVSAACRRAIGHSGRTIRHRHGDSAQEIPGFASVASRSAMAAGSAILATLDAMLAKGKTVAAMVLEAAEGDIAYAAGAFTVVAPTGASRCFDLAAPPR